MYPNYDCVLTKQEIEIYFDNFKFKPKKWVINFEDGRIVEDVFIPSSKKNIEITLNSYEFGLFSKYYANISHINKLLIIKHKNKDRVKNGLQKIKYKFKGQYHSFSALKHSNLVDVRLTQNQIFKVNGENVIITNINSTVFALNKTPIYTIKGEFCD